MRLLRDVPELVPIVLVAASIAAGLALGVFITYKSLAFFVESLGAFR